MTRCTLRCAMFPTDEKKPESDAMVKDMENNMHGKKGQGADHDHDQK